MNSQTKNASSTLCPSVAIVILNWNGWQDTVKCVESVDRQDYWNYRVIIIDNGSTDDSYARIKSWCKERVRSNDQSAIHATDNKPTGYVELDKLAADAGGRRGGHQEVSPDENDIVLIESGDNIGYPGGNNIGISFALKNNFDYIWILNNDTVVDRSALKMMIDFTEKKADAGIAGPLLLHYDRPEIVQSSGYKWVLWREARAFPLPWGRENPLAPEFISVKWLSGASLLVKSSCFRKIGLFDEKYFLNGEDVDLCVRALKAGYKNYCCLKSRVWHKWGILKAAQRKTVLGKEMLRLPLDRFRTTVYYEVRNSIYFVKKNFPLYLPPFLFLRTPKLLLCIALFDDQRIKRMKVLLTAIKDGIFMKMGKRPEPVG
jgi:GT2 family glycosyltransferase